MKCLIPCLLTLLTLDAQEIIFENKPENPTSKDAVQLKIARDFPTPCYATSFSFERDANEISIILTSVPTSEICPAVISPQSATIPLGLLSAGSYQVELTWQGTPGGKDDTATYFLEIMPALELELLASSPARMRFASSRDARYQVEWSPDLINWFDLGDPITGDGNIILVSDDGESAPGRFYRLRQLP